MATERNGRPETFLSRWSRRKLTAAREAPSAAATPRTADAPGVPSSVTPAPAAPTPTPAAAAAAAPSLPPVESLTFDSDFTAFLAPGVAPEVQRAALRKLLRDPRFNAMDGLDIYIGDYTKPSPLDPAIARTLWRAQSLLAQSSTRVDEPPAGAASHGEPPTGQEAIASPDTPQVAEGSEPAPLPVTSPSHCAPPDGSTSASGEEEPRTP